MAAHEAMQMALKDITTPDPEVISITIRRMSERNANKIKYHILYIQTGYYDFARSEANIAGGD